MFAWPGPALIAVGCGLLVSGVMKRRRKARAVGNAAAIRPAFAALGEMLRPILLLGVSLVAVKMTAFYFLFGGARFMSPLTFGGFLFVLAAYAGWLGLVISPAARPEAPNRLAASRGIAAAGEANRLA